VSGAPFLCSAFYLQLVHFRVWVCLDSNQEEARQAPRYVESEVRHPLRHGPDHLQYLSGVGTFKDISSYPSAHGGEHRVVLLEYRQHTATPAWGFASRIRRAVSMPLRSGILMDI